MKTLNKILSVALTGLIMAGCNDLDTEFKGSYVTDKQKEEASKADPTMTRAAVIGITSTFSSYQTVYSNHIDFGYPSVMLCLDSRGMDLVGYNTGYNWFNEPNEMDDANVSGYTPNLAWDHIYSQIFSANALLAAQGTESDDPTIKFFLAQAYGIRAFDYFQLAQIFQFTYVGHQSEPCVPIITQENATEMAAAGGAPRATVEEVYTQILSDINAAITNLEAAADAGITPESVIDSKSKRLLGVASAYGLRARINLVMNKWADAASDAQTAIAKFNGAPYSLQAASAPLNLSLEEKSWMWGIAIAETDRVVTSGLVNWPSHMGSLNYGYAQVGAWRKINIKLFDAIQPTDARKGWFLNENSESPNLSASQMAYVEGYSMPAYTQVKFAPYQNVLDQSTNACDIPLMRIEEMYYINAEATAMAGNPAGAAQILNDFVNTFRDPAYVCSATTAEEVQNEVWMQRRVEFWGEGISYFDLMRLKKGIDRRGGGWEAVWVYDIPAESNVMRLPIPNSEVQANANLGENNPSSEKPTPVAE